MFKCAGCTGGLQARRLSPGDRRLVWGVTVLPFAAAIFALSARVVYLQVRPPPCQPSACLPTCHVCLSTKLASRYPKFCYELLFTRSQMHFISVYVTYM